MDLNKYIKDRYQNNKFTFGEKNYKVKLNTKGISIEHTFRPLEYIEWDDVNEIVVLLRDEGPGQPSLWFVFTGKNQKCSIPQGATDFNGKALEKIMTLFKSMDLSHEVENPKIGHDITIKCWSKK